MRVLLCIVSKHCAARQCDMAEAAKIAEHLAALCKELTSRLQVLVPLHCRYFTRDEGPPGTSIFVRNLPESITAEKLAEIFAKFGALRGAQPVSLKKQKDKDIFAFVDFQEPSAQQAAIASPPTLEGQQVCFEDVPDPTLTTAFTAACFAVAVISPSRQPCLAMLSLHLYAMLPTIKEHGL